jgi:large subunit ribosomal protein L19e
MNLKLQRRLAAQILKIGETRVWMDNDQAEEISKAITRNDVRGLISRGLIKEKPKMGISRGRTRHLESQRRKGRRKGYGKRKGRATARTPAKESWMNKVRALRRLAKAMKVSGQLNVEQYRDIYKKIKGNFFRSRAHLRMYAEKFKAR